MHTWHMHMRTHMQMAHARAFRHIHACTCTRVCACLCACVWVYSEEENYEDEYDEEWMVTSMWGSACVYVFCYAAQLQNTSDHCLNNIASTESLDRRSSTAAASIDAEAG